MSVEWTLQQDHRPRHEIAVLERETDRFPTLRSKRIEAIRLPRIGVLLQALGLWKRDDEVLPPRLRHRRHLTPPLRRQRSHGGGSRRIGKTSYDVREPVAIRRP